MEDEYMTRQGYEKLKAKKAELEQKLYEAGQAAGEAAGLSCDWHDNPGYDMAVEEMRMLAAQIAEVDTQLRRAKLIEEVQSSSLPEEVGIGCRVTVEIDNEEEVYFIGGTADSNPDQGVISYKSPLAQAILGSKVGDIRSVEKPSHFEVKVLKIEKPS
ncbi:MAG TPA: GreA/GreB family elongation factor [Nitrososphaerales archaeon]